MISTTISGFYSKLKSKPLITGIVFIILAFGIAHVADKAAKVLFVQRIVDQNTEYLEASTVKSGAAFLTLSTIKAAVSVFEGSTIGGEAGATVDVQVGDVVQPIYDFVDVAWRVTFASSIVLLGMNLMLQIVFGWGLPAMIILFFAVALAWIIRNQFPNQRIVSGFIEKLVRLFVAIVLCIYIGLPLAVTGARYLSLKISTPMIDQGLDEFVQLEGETSLEAINEKYFEDDGNSAWWNIKGKFDQFKDKAQEFIDWCGQRIGSLLEKGVRYFAGVIFDCLVFAGTFLLVIYLTLKKGLAGFGVSNGRTIREDIRWALEQKPKPGRNSGAKEEA